MSNVFKRVWVDNYMVDGAFVFWDLSIEDKGLYEFQVEWARSPNGEWAPVSQIPVTDTYFMADPEQRVFGKYIDVWYRVVLNTGTGEYTSDPVRGDGGIPYKDWLTAREMVRLEYLHMVKGPSGLAGCLLKRRNWGQRCPVCTDYDTGSVSDDRCIVCYGVGIVNGYYSAVEYPILRQVGPVTATVKPPSGHTSNNVIQARSVAFPVPSPGDVWVQTGTGQRWIIGEGQNTIAVASEVKGKPVIMQLNLALAPTSNILYNVPLTTCVGNSNYDGSKIDECATEQEQEQEQEDFYPIDVPDY